MIFTPLSLAGLIRIEPRVFGDARGFFFESYHQARFAEHGIEAVFVQDNHSCSQRGVIRGLHFQIGPWAQGKLIRVIKGAVFDVAVDIRVGSPTFGAWTSENLSADNRRMLYIPPGFAHGFCALEDGTEVLYKTTQVYSPEHERGVAWNDPEIGIGWPELDVAYLVSEKDRTFPRLREIAV
jgi:dTDP-4-dehydrorhamnose 3,5-epimerase